MKNITLKQAQRLTREPLNTIRSRVKRYNQRTHTPTVYNGKGELVFPRAIALPEQLATKELKKALEDLIRPR